MRWQTFSMESPDQLDSDSVQSVQVDEDIRQSENREMTVSRRSGDLGHLR